MSVAYGGAPGGAGYQPTGRVNFGWIGESFALFKANIGVWLVAVLLLFVPSLIGGIIGFAFGASAARSGGIPGGQPPFGQAPFGQSPFGTGTNAITGGLPPFLYFAIQIFSILYGAWLYGGVYRTAVKQVRGEMISIGDLFSGGPLLWTMLGFNIVYGLLTGAGFVLCLLPGFLLVGLLFPGYALIADGVSFGDAISRSFDAMKRDMWNAAAFMFVLLLLVIVSVFACGLGEFVTLPMLFLCAALAYRDMIGMPGANSPPSGLGYGTAAPGVWPPPPSAGPDAAPPPPQWGSSEPPPDPRL